MAFTYIIYSNLLDKFYVGACNENLKERIENHINGAYGSKSYTHIATDWELQLAFELEDYGHAVRLEKKIKSMKSKVYIKNLIKYPELREKIVRQTKGI